MIGPAGIHWPEDHRPSQWRYKLGCRHRDCSADAVAAVAASSRRAAVRGKADPSLIPHGTPCGYTYWQCRCDECKETARYMKAASVARCKQRNGIPLTDWDAEVLAFWESRKAAA